MRKHGTAGKRKHATLTILQTLEIIRRLESCARWSVCMASYSVELSAVMI
jgi:hypothetical protein